jgi:hypothetical protein
MFNAPNRDVEAILAGIPEPHIAVAFEKCPPYFKLALNDIWRRLAPARRCDLRSLEGSIAPDNCIIGHSRPPAFPFQP